MEKLIQIGPFCFCMLFVPFAYILLLVKIKLLKILALLGSGDKQASGHMYTVLEDIIRRSDSMTNIGNAVLYQCICCVASIYPNPKLLEAAADVIAKFLKVWGDVLSLHAM